MKFHTSIATIALLGMTGVFATPSPQDNSNQAVTIDLPYAVFDEVNFNPAIHRLKPGATARVLRRNNPSLEASSTDLFYIPPNTAGKTCTLDFRFRSSTGSSISGTGQSQIFTCNPVYNASGAITECTRDQFLGTIQASLDGTTTFIAGQGGASGVMACSDIAGKTLAIQMAAVGDTDAIYWKVGSGDGPIVRVQ